MPDGPMGHRFVGVALNQREATQVTVSIGDDVVTNPEVPQMKCPHCDKSIAVRLEQPGKKAARRRTLRARKAQKLREIETSNEEE